MLQNAFKIALNVFFDRIFQYVSLGVGILFGFGAALSEPRIEGEEPLREMMDSFLGRAIRYFLNRE